MKTHVIAVLGLLFILGCADESPPSSDCRNLSQVCSPGFSCVQAESGAYECEPDAPNSDMSTSDASGTDMNTPDIGEAMPADMAIDAITPATDMNTFVDDMRTPDAEFVTQSDCVTYPEWVAPENAGIAYITHLESSSLLYFRATEGVSEPLGSIRMESMVYDSNVDSQHDLLALAHDVTRSVSLYQLSRPTAEGVADPVLAARIDLAPYAPRKLVFDMARRRLHVVANAPLRPGQLLRNEHLFSYDISNPATPTPLSEAPITIPVVLDIAMDQRNGYLFMVDILTENLQIFDAAGSTVTELGGTPINLRVLYPEQSPSAFDPRDVYIDPIRGRVLIGRAQGLLSELIAFRYPPTTTDNPDCVGRPTYKDFVRIEDSFDLTVDFMDRVTIWSSWHAIPIIGTPRMLFVYSEGPTGKAMVTPLEEANGTIGVLEGCGEYEGFGCYYRSYYEGNPQGFHLTDGGSCFDQTNNIFVGTSVHRIDEGANGWAFFFRLHEDGTMSRVLSAQGRHHTVSAYPVTAECH